MNTYAQHYFMKRYTVEEGLSGNWVFGLFTDSRGYLWVSTNNGLSRFDGTQFKNYGMLDGLPSTTNSVRLEDSVGNLWMALKENAALFDGINFHQWQIEGAHDGFWLNGLLRTANNKMWFQTGSGIYELEDTIWKKLNLFPHQPNIHYHDMLKLDDGNILFDLGESLIIWKDSSHFHTIATTDSNHEFRRLIRCGNNIYVCNWNHVWILKNEKLVLVHDEVLANQNIQTVFQDKTGRLWAGTQDNGAFVFEKNSFTHFDQEHNNITGAFSFCEDREGNIWIGTEGNGLIKVKTSWIDFFTSDNESPISFVAANFLDNKGTLLFGKGKNSYMEWNGTSLIGHDQVINKNNKSRSEAWISNLLKDNQQQLWIATNQSQLFRIVNQHIEDVTEKFRINTYVDAIINDNNDSSIYAVNSMGLLHIFKNDTYTTDTFFHNHSDRINFISKDSSGNIWVALEKGNVFMKNKNGIQQMNDALQIGGVTLTSIYFASTNTLWVSTNGKGIFRFHSDEKNNWTNDLHLTRGNGLPDDAIREIAIDRRNKLWITSQQGLASVNFINIDTSKIFSVTQYDEAEGFGNTDFEYPSVISDHDGNIWYGTNKYIARIRANDIPDDTIPPRIHIEEVQLLNGNTEWKNYTSAFSSFFNLPLNPVLPYNQNGIEIQFKAITFTNDKNVVYYYQLVGADKQWINGGNNTHVTYSYLAPGKYIFKVRAKKSGSLWSRDEASFAFIITPPWYLTWWFRSIVILTIGTFIYALYKFRLMQLVRMQNLRNRIAHDLHDEIGSTLNSISIYSEVVKKKIPNEIQELNLIGESARKVIDAMGDIVWTINSENDSFEKIIFRMRSLTHSLMKAKKIEYSFKVEEKIGDIKLSMLVRRNFYLVFKEALNNLVKYSNASRVSISIAEKDSFIELMIRDNGIGFDFNNSARGNGIINMNRRAKEMKADFKIESSVGKGTSIQLILNKKISL